MKPQDALGELLARVGAERGTPIVVNDEELSQWPAAAVAAMKSHKLLMKARPAASVVCSGCERECLMTVHTVSNAARTASFVVCDKRSDINRVPVLIERLTQWRATGDQIADALAELIGCGRAISTTAGVNQWPIGVFKGKKLKSLVTLRAENGLNLMLGGHTIPLLEVLAIEKNSLKLDNDELIRLVDKPADNADAETQEQRRDRLRARVGNEKAKGTKAFLQRVASEEKISVSRLKQITKVISPVNQWQALGTAQVNKRTVSTRKKATR